MPNTPLKPKRPPSASGIFDAPLFVGSLGIMLLVVGVLILKDGSNGERAVGLAHVFAGLVAAGAGMIMGARFRASQPTEDATRAPLQPLASTAFALGVFAVLAALTMDRLLEGNAGVGERLVVLTAAAFAWVLPVQVLRQDRFADEPPGRGRLNGFQPGYFVLMAGATAALATTIWLPAFTASVLILSMSASAIIVAGAYGLDRRSRHCAD